MPRRSRAYLAICAARTTSRFLRARFVHQRTEPELHVQYHSPTSTSWCAKAFMCFPQQDRVV